MKKEKSLSVCEFSGKKNRIADKLKKVLFEIDEAEFDFEKANPDLQMKLGTEVRNLVGERLKRNYRIDPDRTDKDC